MACARELLAWFAPEPVRVVIVEPADLEWVDCPMCWAQRRVLAHGSWWPCGTCLGVGKVAR